MAKNDEITIQPDDAVIDAQTETNRSPSKAELQAEIKNLKAKIAAIRNAFPKNGHIQRLTRD